jgi:hypothetical protein
MADSVDVAAKIRSREQVENQLSQHDLRKVVIAVIASEGVSSPSR